MQRVVVTGMAGISPLGNDWPAILGNLRAGRTGIRQMPDWVNYEGLDTQLGAPAMFHPPAHFNRKKTRSMGRVAQMATHVAEQALEQAGLLGEPVLTSGRAGVAYGSSAGSTGLMTVSITASRSCSWLISGLCCVDSTTASMPTGLPST